METIAEAKAFIKENVKKKGSICPCCTQFVKLYPRKINAAMSQALILIYKSKNKDFFHIEDYLKDLKCSSAIRGDFAKLRFFGLLEKKSGVRKDGSKRNGFYKITKLGEDFINNGATVPKSISIFNNKIYETSEELVDIDMALGEKFDFTELMNG
jgi:tRNA-binding EMAP/Myf-like protein